MHSLSFSFSVTVLFLRWGFGVLTSNGCTCIVTVLAWVFAHLFELLLSYAVSTLASGCS
jgi:hypothetical protein